VRALADSGAVHLCLPEHLALQLQLKELERREVVLADGRRRSVPYMGPVEVRFANRRCFVATAQRESRESESAAERCKEVVISADQLGSAAIRLPISRAWRP
jgi:hypothetical protein